MIRTLVEALFGLAAQAIALTRLNTVSSESDAAGRVTICKRRRRYAAWLLVPANQVIRRRCAPVHVLGEAGWIERELSIAQCGAAQAQVVLRGRTLCFAAAPGLPLHRLLDRADLDDERKLEAMFLAAGALRAFHAHTLPGEPARASHGDATVRNVAVDLHARRAVWFDFDLAHALQAEAAVRQADDLRALVFTSLPHLRAELTPALARGVVEHYADAKVLLALKRQLESPWLRFDLYHLAQTLAPPARREACRQALVRAIDAWFDSDARANK